MHAHAAMHGAACHANTYSHKLTVCVQAVAQRGEANLPSCAIMVELEAQGGGSSARRFYGPNAIDAAHRPRLELVYEPPSTAAQAPALLACCVPEPHAQEHAHICNAPT